MCSDPPAAPLACHSARSHAQASRPIHEALVHLSWRSHPKDHVAPFNPHVFGCTSAWLREPRSPAACRSFTVRAARRLLPSARLKVHREPQLPKVINNALALTIVLSPVVDDARTQDERWPCIGPPPRHGRSGGLTEWRQAHFVQSRIVCLQLSACELSGKGEAWQLKLVRRTLLGRCGRRRRATSWRRGRCGLLRQPLAKHLRELALMLPGAFL